MLLKQYLIQLLSVITAFTMASDNSDMVLFLKNFLLQYNYPVRIVSLLCWKRSEKLHLWKMLNSYNFQATVHDLKVNDIRYSNTEEHQLLLIMDANCYGHESILKKAGEMNLFQFPIKWLIIDLNEIPSDLPIFPDSQIYLANNAESKKYEIQLIYKIHESLNYFSRNNVGIWTGNRFLNFTKECFGQKRLNLQGVTINVSAVFIYNDSLNHLDDYKFRNADTMSKTSFMLFKHVIDMLNITPNYLFSNTWGYKTKNETKFPGMIGQLQDNLVVLSATPMYITSDRSTVADFITDPVKTRITFLFRSPPLSYVENIYTLAFNLWTWIVSFGILITTTLLFYIIAKWEKNHFDINEEKSYSISPLNPKLSDVLLLEIGVVCQQGAESEPKSGSGRILTIFIYIFITFLYTSYTAFIVALFQSTTNNIQTIEDLLTSNIKLGAENTPYNHAFFALETEPLRKALYEKKLSPKGTMENFISMPQGIMRMRDEFYAFHAENGPAYKVINDLYDESQKCGIQQIDVWGLKSPWIPVPKKSNYKKILTISYRKLKEYGLEEREHELFYVAKPKCTVGRNIFKSIELIDCYYIFVIMGFGFSLSLLTLIIEILIAKFKRLKVLRQRH